MTWKANLPAVRGKLLFDEPLAPFTWFRVGGPAEVLFLPADPEDLGEFLRQLPQGVPVTALGVGSNVIIRDGGVPGVVIRCAGKAWGEVLVDGIPHRLAPGVALYIPGGAVHGVPQAKAPLRWFYTFAATSFSDIDYSFLTQAGQTP